MLKINGYNYCVTFLGSYFDKGNCAVGLFLFWNFQFSTNNQVFGTRYLPNLNQFKRKFSLRRKEDFHFKDSSFAFCIKGSFTLFGSWKKTLKLLFWVWIDVQRAKKWTALVGIVCYSTEKLTFSWWKSDHLFWCWEIYAIKDKELTFQ